MTRVTRGLALASGQHDCGDDRGVADRPGRRLEGQGPGGSFHRQFSCRAVQDEPILTALGFSG